MASNNFIGNYFERVDSVFIEKDNEHERSQMKELLSSGCSQDIRKFFFSSATSSDLSIGKVTQSQIKKHSQILTCRNKLVLKYLLKKGKCSGQSLIQGNGFQEQKTNFAVSGNDGDNMEDGEIWQYLNMNQGIEFSEMQQIV